MPYYVHADNGVASCITPMYHTYAKETAFWSLLICKDRFVYIDNYIYMCGIYIPYIYIYIHRTKIYIYIYINLIFTEYY